MGQLLYISVNYTYNYSMCLLSEVQFCTVFILPSTEVHIALPLVTIIQLWISVSKYLQSFSNCCLLGIFAAELSDLSWIHPTWYYTVKQISASKYSFPNNCCLLEEMCCWNFWSVLYLTWYCTVIEPTSVSLICSAATEHVFYAAATVQLPDSPRRKLDKNELAYYRLDT